MSNKLKVYALAACCLIMLAIAGCKKDSTAANLAYVGTYSGTATINGNLKVDSVKVTTGSSSNLVNIFDVTDSITVIGTVSGNTITSVTGSVEHGTGCTESVSGQGNLVSTLLTLNLYGAYSCSGNSGHDTVAYSVIKVY